jgi:two-component system chemotaxis sensor kinase CheA
MADLSVEELRRGLLTEFDPVAQGQGLGYSIDVAVDSPKNIVTDPPRLRQILKNLLANAFKFTEHGDVAVRVWVASNGWSPETESLVGASAVLGLSVTDTGVGIVPEQRQRIFEAFAQGDGTTARLYGGTGLGLSISRELVGLLGGEITVASTQGEGSTFTVYLPLGRSPSLTPAPDRSGALVAANEGAARHVNVRSNGSSSSNGDYDEVFAGTKVLVVDDDYRNVFALTALLERGHAEVRTAESGADAIAVLKSTPDIHIVLMDIMMPVMDGYATMRAIRALDQFQSTHLIAVTGKVVAGERERCMAAGADDYVPKPVDTAELLAIMVPWLPAAEPAVP